MTARPAWFPDWSNEVAAVVAAGASLVQADLDLLRGRVRTIVVNRSFELAPWADALYAADPKFWEHYKAAQSFAGLRITSCRQTAARLGLHAVTVSSAAHAMRLDLLGTVGHGGHSGFQALNLALQFGARRVLLLGFDLAGEHWHGAHSAPLRNPRPPTLDKWRKRLDSEAFRLAKLGVAIINCAPASALAAYEKMPVRAALERFGLAERAAA